MTTNQAAGALGISRARVIQFISDKRLKAEQHGRDWWITPEALEEFRSNPRKNGRPAKK